MNVFIVSRGRGTVQQLHHTVGIMSLARVLIHSLATADNAIQFTVLLGNDLTIMLNAV